jgi:c-di-GMP-binding flagellar brake protein YcgR
MNTANLLQNSIEPTTIERRRFHRLKRAVQTELRAEAIETPMRTETADLSAGGCYIETVFTLEIGTFVTLALWLGHKKLVLNGKVVTRHKQFGNGIEFGKMSSEARTLLLTFIEDPNQGADDRVVANFGEGLIV